MSTAIEPTYGVDTAPLLDPLLPPELLPPLLPPELLPEPEPLPELDPVAASPSGGALPPLLDPHACIDASAARDPSARTRADVILMPGSYANDRPLTPSRITRHRTGSRASSPR